MLLALGRVFASMGATEATPNLEASELKTIPLAAGARSLTGAHNLRQFLSWCGLLVFVRGRRSLRVAST